MKIYINFDVLENNGNDYLNFSKDLNEIIVSLKKECQNIDDNWISTNAPIYNNQMNSLINDMQIDANRMQKYADIILKIKDDFQEKDLEYANKSEMVYKPEVNAYEQKYN